MPPRNRFFNVTLDAQVAPPAPAAAPAMAPETPPRVAVGVLTSPQSALTFAGAPAAVVTILQVTKQVRPMDASVEKVVGLILSFAIGLVIYLISETNAKTGKEKLQSGVLALINTFAIAAAVLGISAA